MLRFLVVAALVLVVLPHPAFAADGDGAPGARRPALVLIVAIDQLRRDRLDPALPGGLGRLAREGRAYSDAQLDHAVTETCPGHVAMATGREPGPIGVTANSYIERESGERRYCVADPAPDAAVIGGDDDPQAGRSPRAIRADALGDWLKATFPDARVFAVSAKDRAAIALGGQHPDGVYWLQKNGALRAGPDGSPDAATVWPGFTTSRYYQSALPGWVTAWNAPGLAARVPDQWIHPSEPIGSPPRVDDYPGESDERSRTSPHPLHDDDPEQQADDVYHSPFVDLLTLDFARTLVESEDLGRHDAPDLLAISLSATDTVGHAYGPGSLEARDALLRLDGALGEFLAGLEARVGPGGLVVALSADHGVLPLPESLAETGALECPVDDGRVGLVSMVLRLYAKLHFELSPFSWPRPWLNVASELTVDRALARDRGVPVDEVVAVAERWLEAQPAVRAAWTWREVVEGRSELARLYRNSLDPERSGDLFVQFEPTCLADFDGTGTSHGSPYAYDRDVPLVFWGPGFAAGRVPGPARTIDLAPTLAARLAVAVPANLDGRDLLAGARVEAGAQRREAGVASASAGSAPTDGSPSR